jgi:glycosyltransferase involved in cell wall biosynthesis
MKKTKICFIGANPYFEGGIGLYQRNLIKYIRENHKEIEIEVIYFGRENKKDIIDGVKYLEIGNKFPYPLDQIVDNFKILKYLKKNNFDVINSHALWGYWMNFYKKRKGQKLVHTYHGVTYNYFKTHLRRFSLIKKVLMSPLLLFSYVIEKPPIKKADSIICVSEKVKRQLGKLYSSTRNMSALRTGVDIKEFNPRDKNIFRKKLNLEKDKTYGLYIGKGGYWMKGLDRAINLSQKIYNKNKYYRLIIVGAEYNKIKHLIKKDFIIYIEKVPREKISYYYNACDMLFYLSRYDGGAPTLVVSEGMASGCLIVFSKDSEQEIIVDNKNGIVLDNFEDKGADRIIDILKNRKKRDAIVKNSVNTIKDISLEKWGKDYLQILK